MMSPRQREMEEDIILIRETLRGKMQAEDMPPEMAAVVEAAMRLIAGLLRDMRTLAEQA